MCTSLVHGGVSRRRIQRRRARTHTNVHRPAHHETSYAQRCFVHTWYAVTYFSKRVPPMLTPRALLLPDLASPGLEPRALLGLTPEAKALLGVPDVCIASVGVDSKGVGDAAAPWPPGGVGAG